MTLPKTSLFGFRGDGGALIAGAVFSKMRRTRNRFKNSLITKHKQFNLVFRINKYFNDKHDSF